MTPKAEQYWNEYKEQKEKERAEQAERNKTAWLMGAVKDKFDQQKADTERENNRHDVIMGLNHDKLI